MTTYSELIRQTMLRLQPRSDGITRLAVEQAITDAQRVIASIKDFDDLMTLDTTNAFTAVITSGAISVVFAEIGSTITRTTGSFITNGFVAGVSITTNSNDNPGPFTLKTVAALILTVNEDLENEANAACTITFNKKLYHVEDDLDLTRPKDIYSIRLIDGSDSRKLEYVPFRELDSRVPYTELVGTGKPSWYTIRGEYVEFFRIPDKEYPLYIQHSQWPEAANYANANATTPFRNIDHVIVTLAADMALASLEGGSSDWFQRAKQLLGIALNEEDTRPDQTLVAQPFNPTYAGPIGEYWNNPFIKGQPL